MQCVICIEGPFQNICTFISMISLIYQISQEGVFFREKLDQVKRDLRMCVFVCVGGGAYYIPKSTSTHKSVWNPLLPQINISEQCESVCKRQIVFENPPEPTLAFDSGTEFSVTCQSIHHVMSLSVQHDIHTLSRSGQMDSNPWRMTI